MKLKKLFEDILREKNPTILKNPTKEEIEDFVNNINKNLRFCADIETKNIYFWDSHLTHNMITSMKLVKELEPFSDSFSTINHPRIIDTYDKTLVFDMIGN